MFISSTNPELALREWNALNFIEKIILETKLTRQEYKVKLISLLAFKVLGHYIFFFMMASRLKTWEVGLRFLSLYQDVTHGFDVLVPIVWRVRCLISTRVGIIMNLGEGCVPVGWYLGLLGIKASLASSKVIGTSVAPELGIVMESCLKDNNCIFYLPKFISIISRVSERRQGINLRAGNLHGQCPSSIPTSKVSHVTENRNRLWTKHQRVYLASSRP